MLSILTTHPIQYQAPVWQALARDGTIPFEVWYLSEHGSRDSLDHEFGQSFQWDLDLLSGYPHRFLDTTPSPADISHFRGTRIGSLKQLFAANQVSAMWINGWQVQAYWQAAFEARRRGIPVWLRAESNDLHRSSPVRRLPRQVLLRTLFSSVAHFLTVGSANRRLYRQFGVPERKLISTPYCVDNDRFVQAATDLAPQRAALRRSWNIPDDAICFLFAGKFIPKKRPLDLLQAIERLLDDPTQSTLTPEKIHLLMAGSGELQPQIKSIASRLERKHGRSLVTFAGFLNQTAIPTAYCAADCLVLPSDAGETWGLVVNEAMASGRPAIVSDLCGCAEDMAAPLGRGFVYPCGDVAMLCRSLVMACQSVHDPQLLSSAKAIAERHHLAHTVGAISSLYNYTQR